MGEDRREESDGPDYSGCDGPCHWGECRRDCTLKADVKESAKAYYTRLRDLVKRQLTGNASAEMVLAEYEGDPKTWEAPLTKTLAEAGAGDHPDLVAAAVTLMELVDQTGAKSGRYVIIANSTGVQAGDGNNLQINNF